MRIKNLTGSVRSDLKNSTPSPRKRRKTTSSGISWATGAWGLTILLLNLTSLGTAENFPSTLFKSISLYECKAELNLTLISLYIYLFRSGPFLWLPKWAGRSKWDFRWPEWRIAQSSEKYNIVSKGPDLASENQRIGGSAAEHTLAHPKVWRKSQLFYFIII